MEFVMAFAILSSLPLGLYGPTDSGPNSANLETPGEKTLTLIDGKHRIVVTLTVATKPKEWPELFVVGPTSSDFEPTNDEYRIVTAADIRVDGCHIEQPWPPIAGMSMPRGAALFIYKGHWELEIDGPGDGAEVDLHG